MKGIIYCALFPNGKKYYGQTINPLKDRIRKHNRDSINSDLLFHRALRKYNNKVRWIEKESFEGEDLKIILNEREKFWIQFDKTNVLKNGIKYGYNLTDGGEGGDTFSKKSHSLKTREQMSVSRKNYLKEHGNVLKGRERPEHSKRMTGKGNPMFNKHHTKESKDQISKHKLGVSNPKSSLTKTGKKLINGHFLKTER
jgi:group I intron endonuclease